MGRYWALKTWDNDGKGYSEDKDKWRFFLSDQVIAIGWLLDITLTETTPKSDIYESLERYRAKTNNKIRPTKTAFVIYNFINICKDDHVLLCGGYNEKTPKVRLYGTANKIRDFNDCPTKWEWKIKHHADVSEFPPKKRLIENGLLVTKLEQGKINGKELKFKTLESTLQEISKEGYESVVEWAELDG